MALMMRRMVSSRAPNIHYVFNI